MPTITLNFDQVGDLAHDGSIMKHPEQDIFGQPYSRVNATRKQLSKSHFVVIPTGKDSDDNVFVLPADKPVSKSKE